MTEGNVGGLSQASSKDDLRQPASTTDRQRCKEVSRVTEACVEAEGRHFEHSQ